MKRTERDLIPNTPRNIRLDAGMSAADVCSLTGWTASAQSRFERGRTNPKASTLAVFYAACGRDDLVAYLTPLMGPSDFSVVQQITRDRAARFPAVSQRV